MKYFLLLIIISSIQLFSSDWKHVFDSESGKIVKINYVDSKYTYFNCSATRRNKIFRSSDLGITWEKIYDKDGFENTPPLFNFDNFIQIDSSNWFLTYRDNHIQKTTDGGETFETIKIGDKDVNQFSMYDNLVGIIRAGQYIYLTNDGWNTKKMLNEVDEFGTETNFVFKNSKNIFCISYSDDENLIPRHNLVVINTDSQVYKLIYHFNFFKKNREYISEISYINKYLIFAVGRMNNGIGDQNIDLIFRSKDSGKSWEKLIDQEITPIFGLNRISFYDEVNGIATGNSGKIYLTKDGGESWHIEDPDDMKQVWHEDEKTYGPSSTVISWLDTIPILGSFGGHIYRYEGDFFNFNYEKISSCNLISPINKVENIKTFEFKWESVKDAELYKLQISEDIEFDSIAFENITTDISSEFTNLKANQKYYWRVITEKGTQIRESEIREFTTGISIPTELYPTCESFDVSLDSSLTWSKIENIDNYQVELSETIDFTTIFATKEVNSNTYTLENLENGTKYYWKVKANLENKESNWSDACNFTTKLSNISNFSPECNSFEIDLNVSLSWTDIKGVKTYELQFSEEEEMQTFKQVDSIKINEYELTDLKIDQNYYWRVRGVNDQTTTDWSEICNFQTKTYKSVKIENNDYIQINGNNLTFQKQVNNIRIIDLLGNYTEFNNTMELDLSNLQQGIYIIQFTHKKQIHNYKFIKE